MSEENQLFEKNIDFVSQNSMLMVLGEFDNKVRDLEKENNVKIVARGHRVTVSGLRPDVESVVKKLNNAKTMPDTMKNMESLIKTVSGKVIVPANKNQIEYIRAMNANEIVISIGPAGTGKTFIACIQAVLKLRSGEIDRVILTRPVVEAGEKLGYLPGDLYEKVNPYLAPLYDSFHTLLGASKFQHYRKNGVIEIIPLAYMRGRTLDDCMVILDEAQNTTAKQMKMFLTRLGFNSKAVITGDITQVDLSPGSRSGLIDIQGILKGLNGIKFIYFDGGDVIRHPIVKEIVNAYKSAGKD